jgi:hypothetical protein
MIRKEAAKANITNFLPKVLTLILLEEVIFNPCE